MRTLLKMIVIVVLFSNVFTATGQGSGQCEGNLWSFIPYPSFSESLGGGYKSLIVPLGIKNGSQYPGGLEADSSTSIYATSDEGFAYQPAALWDGVDSYIQSINPEGTAPIWTNIQLPYLAPGLTARGTVGGPTYPVPEGFLSWLQLAFQVAEVQSNFTVTISEFQITCFKTNGERAVETVGPVTIDLASAADIPQKFVDAETIHGFEPLTDTSLTVPTGSIKLLDVRQSTRWPEQPGTGLIEAYESVWDGYVFELVELSFTNSSRGYSVGGELIGCIQVADGFTRMASTEFSIGPAQTDSVILRFLMPEDAGDQVISLMYRDYNMSLPLGTYVLP